MLGTDIVGAPSKSALYGWKEKPPTLSAEGLLQSASWRRRRMSQTSVHSDDPVLQATLWEMTLREVQEGFLQGPFNDEQEVQAALQAQSFVGNRRFVIDQSSPTKVKFRVIDDLKESGVNAAYHSLERLELHDVDYFVSLCSFVAACIQGDQVQVSLETGHVLKGRLRRDFAHSPEWAGRCLDLSQAYKQVLISISSLPYGVLLVHNPENQGRPSYFLTQSLPFFGACAAVFAFNRLSRSLLHLAMHLCATIGRVFYDDYPMVEPFLSSTLASMSIENLLTSLGWKYASNAEKGQLFQGEFDLLGMQLNVRGLLQGLIVLQNKPSRVAKLQDSFSRIQREGRLAKHEAQTLHGQLNFMLGFAQGRSMKTVCMVCRALANFAIRSMATFALAQLATLQPRKICLCGPKSPVLIFTDASYERGIARWGICTIDQHSCVREVSGGIVPKSLVDFWRLDIHDQIITQAEAYAVLLARSAYGAILRHRRCIMFVDNEGARFSLIKGSSPSRTLLMIAVLFHDLEAQDEATMWIERVPSESNVADLPSRGLAAEAAKLIGASVRNLDDSARKVASLCQACDDLPWDLLSKSSGKMLPTYFC